MQAIDVPLVTIAIPIYNADKFLPYAILSCINQTYKNWELLLMCDGSTDSSSLIASEMSSLDNRIVVIDDGENRGLVYRLNQSVKMANGKYYARMDADDIMAVNRIREEVNFLESNPDVDVVGTSMMIIDGNNHIVGSSLRTGGDFFVHPSVMGKTCWFVKNPYDPVALRAEDFDLWNRTYKNSKFANIKIPLMFYRSEGVPTTKKLLTSYKVMRRLSFRYKQYNESFAWAIKHYLIYFVKSIVLLLFSLFGQQRYIVKHRRYVPVPVIDHLHETDLFSAICEV